MPRTFLKSSRKYPASSRARAALRQRRSRQATVSKARAKTIRKIAKNVVMANKETKYTTFQQMQTTQNIQTNATGPYLTVQAVSNLAALYPALGDEKNQREGLKYRMMYLQHVVRVQCTPTQRQQPLHIMIVRAKRRAALTLGTNIAKVTLFPHTQIGSGSAAVLALTGGFEPSAGTIIQQKKVYPPKYLQSSTNRFPSSSSNDLVANNYYTEVLFNIPVNRVINAETYLAEIPTELPLYYCVIYDPDQYNGVASQWTMSASYTRCIFKDI